MLHKLRNQKIWARIVIAITLFMLVGGTGFVTWTLVKQRDMAVVQAKDFSGSAYLLTMASLTEMMISGTISQQLPAYLEQVDQSEDIKGLSIISSEALVKQYNSKGWNPDGIDATAEKHVLDTAQKYFEIVERDGKESLLAILPVIAKSNYLGKNCLTCHAVPEGTVLGAVSMQISLDKMNQAVAGFRIWTVIAAAIFLLLIVGFVYVVIRYSVSKPIEEIGVSLWNIAEGDGNLQFRLKDAGKDEIGTVAMAFNNFMDKLQNIIREVKSSTAEVQMISSELAQASNQIAVSSQQQSQEAYSMASQVTMMTYTLDGLADQAEGLRVVSSDSMEHSTEGGKVIHAAAGEMQQITETVNQSSLIIQELGQQSDQISAIVSTIKDIADQTNLLALNAAIEAARAGEQGRGFAVVADEVRKLAERTANSTTQITQMIGKIQDGTRQAIEGIEDGVKRVTEGTALAKQAGDAINQIQSGVDHVSKQVNEIAISLKEQSQSCVTNSEIVEGIARISDENNSAFNETATKIQHIDELARSLSVLVGRFIT